MPKPPQPLLVPLVAFAGCGFGQLQTARTTPAGLTQTTVGGTVVDTAFKNGREPPSLDATFVPPVAYVPLHLEVRHGLTDNLDFGGRLTFGVGATFDLKWNVLPARWPVAVAVAAGAGGGVAPGERGVYILQVPVMLSASFEVAWWLTPYIGASYRGIWMWGMDDPTRPDFNYTSPTGPGEGLLVPVGGLAIGRAGGRALLVEYGRLETLWHDPGHGYTFVPAHLFSIAFRTGQGPTLER